MSKWYETPDGQERVKKLFAAAGMPEVPKEDLEPGTYTNEELAAFFASGDELWHALNQLHRHADPVTKRSILSFAAEIMPKKN